MTPVAGAVLAGGRSSRFGRDKAMEPVRGRPLAAHVIDAMEAGGCGRVVLVGGTAGTLGTLGHEVIADRWPGEGPLGGVITALSALPGDVVTAACDLAGLDAETVARVIAAGSPERSDESIDAAVAVADGQHVPLVRWNRSCLEILEPHFARGERSLRAAFGHLRTVAVPVAAEAAVDVDSVADLLALDRDELRERR